MKHTWYNAWLSFVIAGCHLSWDLEYWTVHDITPRFVACYGIMMLNNTSLLLAFSYWVIDPTRNHTRWCCCSSCMIRDTDSDDATPCGHTGHLPPPPSRPRAAAAVQCPHAAQWTRRRERPVWDRWRGCGKGSGATSCDYSQVGLRFPPQVKA